MSLFRNEPFVSAGGIPLLWKTECDVLTDDDWECIASIVGPMLTFARVEGVPTGGRSFAQALEPYAHGQGLLIVDDVFTTGGSMERHRDGRFAEGVVLFARNPTPEWIRPVWSLTEWLR